MSSNYTDPFRGTSGTGPDYTGSAFEGYLKNLVKAAESSIDVTRIEDYFLTLEEKAKNLNKTFTASLQGASEEYRKEMSKIYLDNIKYGFAYDDSSKFLDALNTQMGRLVPFSETTTRNALVFGKVIGETPENVGKLLGQFEELAFSQQRTVNILNKSVAIARSYGVDAKKLTATLGTNIKLAQTYGFKNGVEGLTKMAAQAQRIGFDLTKAKTTADLILDGGPEKAIEMASELQALGGNVGALSDMGQLINMAMYDMEGLQNEIVKASAASVSFNETTGDFSISGEEMLRLRKQAQVLGLSYDEVSQAAINMRKEQEIAARVDLSKLSEGQKAFVSGLAEIGEGGNVTIDIPNFDEGTKTLGELMQDNKFIEALEKYQEDVNKTPANLQSEMLEKATDSLSVQEKMNNTLVEIQNTALKQFENDKTGNTILESLAKQTMYQAPGAGIISKITGEIDTAITDLMPAFTSYYTNLKDLTTAVANVAVDAIGVMKAYVESYLDVARETSPYDYPAPTAWPSASDAFIPAGGRSLVKTGFGQILPDVNDELLFSPDISDFFKKYNDTEKKLQEIGVPKSGDLSLMYKSATAKPNMNLTDLVNNLTSQSGPSEIKQVVEIGGKTEVTLNINTNIPQNLISQVLDASELKQTIMNTVNTRLSAEYSDKLSNALITQKR